MPVLPLRRNNPIPTERTRARCNDSEGSRSIPIIQPKLPQHPHLSIFTATPISTILSHFPAVPHPSLQSREAHKPSEFNRLGSLFFPFGCELADAKIS